MNPDIDFRACQSTDLPACASITAKAFPLVTSRFTSEEASNLMKFQIDGCHAVSNYHELAIVDGEVAGLLFGRVKRKPFLIDMCQTLKQLLPIKVRFLLGRYGSRRKLIKLIKPSLQSLRALRRNMPSNEAEVVLFAVTPEHQGIGIGRTLMDRFVRHVVKHRAKAIYVPTDETASFWFYERYGFTRWAEYKDPLESYLANRPVKGFIYQLILRKADGQELEC